MIIHKTHRRHLSTTIDARAVRTRQALRRAMLGLLETRRFEGLTIGELAAAAGVGYSTVCRHYPTLATLLNEIATEEIANAVSQALPRFEVTDPRAASLALFWHIHAHRAVWSVLLTGGAAGALRQEFLRIGMQIARTWNRSGIWLPPELGVTMTISGTIELMTWWLKQADPLPVEEIADIFQRLLVAPVLGSAEPAIRVAAGGAVERGARPARAQSRGRRSAS